MIIIDRAWKQPLRRIYLVWGSVLLVGFTMTAFGFFDGWVHWYFLTVIGLLSQIIGMRLSDYRAKILLGMWGIISLGGTYYSHQLMMGGFEFPSFFTSFAIFWLGILALPQIITGFILKNRFQKILGAVWLVLALVLQPGIISEMNLALVTAAVTGIPYLYIALRK